MWPSSYLVPRVPVTAKMDDGELVELAEGCTSRSTICTTAGVPFPGLTPSMMPQDILGQPNPNEPTNHEVDHCRRS
ncbi:hypothetical protein pipiens_012392 [Culex pipiens pipiens]|uniref:Uncharacterized protein n=1 Tax=Culex pipiens pipiens TaxID=38569 RepID=A0ABD1D2H2_CULPP